MNRLFSIALLRRQICGPLVLALASASICLAAKVRQDGGRWALETGPVTYHLEEIWNGGGPVFWNYFGPKADAPAAWPDPPDGRPRMDLSGRINGVPFGPDDLALTSSEVRKQDRDVVELRLLFRLKTVPGELELRYAAYGDTGVLTRQISVRNSGPAILRLDNLPSLSWMLPSGDYELTYLWGSHNEERQLATETLGPGTRAFVSRRGDSTAVYSPWFSLRERGTGRRYAAQLAWSGNWQMQFELQRSNDPTLDHGLQVQLGLGNDFGGAVRLQPGQSFLLPAVAFTTTTGDLDEAINQLHQYQEQYVIPHNAANRPPLVEYSDWFGYRRIVSADALRKEVDEAARLGMEAFVIDAGWFRKQTGVPVDGDWISDPSSFPQGIEEFSRYVHSKGMKFGLWMEIEAAVPGSEVAQQHPDWFLRYRGVPLADVSVKPGTEGRGPRERHYLNFGNPEVRRWARQVLDRMVRDYGIDWWKFDHNVYLGEDFDSAGGEPSGDVLYRHIMGFYQFLEEVRTAYPNLIIENCAGGGMRFDLAMIGHTDTTFLSDGIDPFHSVQLGYGCTVEFTPEVCLDWMINTDDPDPLNVSAPGGWWDYLFRVAMNGQFGISSRLTEWGPELKQRAIANVAIYKHIREVITGALVYHLTLPPAHNLPVGWMALQYVSPKTGRSVLMAYRLAKGEEQRNLRLRGLEPQRTYRILEDGKPRGSQTGEALMSSGLAVELQAEWRAAVIELEP